ncbi:MAG: alanine:cation symporter family protein, partial [Planctomycetota bacterium]
MHAQNRTAKKPNRALPLAAVLLLSLPGLAIAQTADSQAEAPLTLAGQVDGVLSRVVDSLASVLFYDFGTGAPAVVLWLIAGAIFFTFRMGFINVRAFRHAIEVVRGKYDDPKDKGEVTHFQALTSALSGTVGLGNIAGV